MHFRARCRRIASLVLVCLVARAAAAESTLPPAAVAVTSRTVTIGPASLLPQAGTAVSCFEGYIQETTNPGCFTLPNPPGGGGDCVSHSSQFMVQYTFPQFVGLYRVRSLAFLSNDGATVFPSAGVILMSYRKGASWGLPTQQQLSSLQAHNVPTPHDTATVVVDLFPYNLTFGDSTAIIVAVQFPEGGQLVGPGVGNGPGIAAEDQPPDQNCDYFTIDAGRTGDGWFQPTAHPTKPLDWGFQVIVEPVIPVLPTSWSMIKTLYRLP